jgi:hypothetical protein
MVRAVALAFCGILAYLFFAWGLPGVGNRQAGGQGDVTVYLVAASYLLSALLFLAVERWRLTLFQTKLTRQTRFTAGHGWS